MGTRTSTGSVLPGRAAGLNLSDTGRTQAQRTAELIADGTTIDAVYTSPLERARQTAAPIAAATGQRAKVDRGLLECDFGEWTGQQLSALMKKPEWSTVQRAPSTFRFPGGESFVEMQLRIVSTIERLRAAHPGGTIVCVSHADPIKAAVAQAIGTHLDLFQRIVISPASVSVLACVSPSGQDRSSCRSTPTRHGRSKELDCLSGDAWRFYEFDEVDEFSASAVGEPGSRVFYLSARQGRQRVTVRCEKLQVKAISTWLRNVLNDLPPSENRPMIGQPDLGIAPDHAFVLGPIGLGYDRVNDRLLVQLEELVDADVDDDDDDDDDDDETDDDTERDRPRPHPLLRHTRPGRRVLRPRRPCRRRRPAAVPMVREPDRSPRTRVPAPELSNAAATERLEISVGPVPADAVERLADADVTVLGRMRNASNATFLVSLDDADGLAIYKPGRGERPLWDFPPGLYRREVAAYRAQRGARTARRSADRAASRRPARRRIAAVVRQRRLLRALLLDVRRTPRAPRPTAGDRRVRRDRQQHRSQERTLPAGDRATAERPRLGDRQRFVLLRPRTSCAP